MTKRYLCLVLEFPDDETLATFQRREQIFTDGVVTQVQASVDDFLYHLDATSPAVVHPKLYTTKYHPYAPYVNDVTVNGLRMKQP